MYSNINWKLRFSFFIFSFAAIIVVCCPVCRAKFIQYFIMKNSALLYQRLFVTLFGGVWRWTVVVRRFKAEQVHAIRLWVGRLDWPSGWYEKSNTLTEEIKRYFSQFTERIDSPVHSVRPPIRLANNGREAKGKAKKKFEIPRLFCVAFLRLRPFRCQGRICKIQISLTEVIPRAFLCVSEQPRFFLIKNFLVFFLPPPTKFCAFFFAISHMAAQLVWPSMNSANYV